MDNDCRSARLTLAQTSKSLSYRLIIMALMLTAFMTTEFVVGLAVSSLALVSDSFHMFGDLCAILIGIYSEQVRRSKPGPSATFGSQRAEVVGALINSVFLLAVCLSILKEAGVEIHECVFGDGAAHEKSHGDTQRIIIVGCIGFVMNVIGLCFFGGEHGHSHGGGGHSHSHGGSHSHGKEKTVKKKKHGHSHGHGGHSHSHGECEEEEESGEADSLIEKKKSEKKEANFNFLTRAVYLHVLSDCLGSVAVIASGLTIQMWDSPRAVLADPICSIFIVTIIFTSTIPLVACCVDVLMEKAPEGVDVKKIRKKILKIEGVVTVHEVHVWQLARSRNIATVHINTHLTDNSATNAILVAVQRLFHELDVHETTIQLEYHPHSRGCDDLICAEGHCETLSVEAPVVSSSRRSEEMTHVCENI